MSLTGDKMKEFFSRINERIWATKNPEHLFIKKIKLFVVIGTVLIAISKFLYLQGITFPNLELIIPTLIVIGSFSFYCGNSKFLKRLTRYFGILALISVYLIDLSLWGFRIIYAFTWSGFLFAWLLGLRNKLSPFDKYNKLLYHTTITGIFAILIFDIWTCFGTWLFWYPKTITGLISAYLAQIPFTLYHLSSLIFIPPLVLLAKLVVKVKIPVAISVPVRTGIKTKRC